MTTMRWVAGRLMLAGITTLLGASAAASQNAPKTKDLPYTIPQSPAFHLIGANPTEVTRPGTARELGVSLLSAVDTAGRLQQGFALEFSPALALAGDMDLEAYQSSFWNRLIKNTTISLGTTKAAADESSTLAAVGVRMVLVDWTDPMRDPRYTDPLGRALEGCTDFDLELDEAIACAREEQERYREEYAKAYWNGWLLAVGGAVGMQFTGSRIADRGLYGSAAWVVAAAPLGGFGQFVAQGQYNERDPDATDESDSFSYGGKLYLGSGTAHGFAEVTGRSLLDAPVGADDFSAEWSAGMEFRASDDTWITTGFGSRFDTLDEPDRIFLIAGIRWNVSSGPRFGR